MNLERAVQLSVDIAAHLVADLKQPAPMSMAQSFEMLFEAGVIDAKVAERMQKSVGFRNIAVHEYRMVDWGVVYSIITKNLSDFNEYARQVVKWFDQHDV